MEFGEAYGWADNGYGRSGSDCNGVDGYGISNGLGTVNVSGFSF